MRSGPIGGAITLALALAPGAWAQPADQQLDAAVRACLSANKDKFNPPADDLAACEPALAAIGNLRAAGVLQAPHDINLGHMYAAFVHTSIGGAYAEIDGVRSSRVCAKTEASWSELAQIVDANSPSDYVDSFKAMRSSSIAPIAKCRAEKGTPAGAPPIPQ